MYRNIIDCIGKIVIAPMLKIEKLIAFRIADGVPITNKYKLAIMHAIGIGGVNV